MDILLRRVKELVQFGGLDLIVKVTAVAKLKMHGGGHLFFSEITVMS